MSRSILVKIDGECNHAAQYQTMLSLLNQTTSDDYVFYVDGDMAGAKNARLREVAKNKTYDYILQMKAGAVITKSFLYKATTYLKLNDAVAVCPEVTLALEKQAPTVKTIINQGRIASGLETVLMDGEIANEVASYRVAAVADTAVVVREIPEKMPDYLEDEVLVKPEIMRGTIKNQNAAINNGGYYFPSDILLTDLNELAKIDLSISGLKKCYYENITKKYLKTQERIGKYYQAACKEKLLEDEYYYVLVLPWLIRGGVDLFAVNYANTIAELNPDKKLLIITTVNVRKTLPVEELGLNDNISLVDLATIVPKGDNYEQDVINVLHSIINNVNPKFLHVMMSMAGFELMIKHGKQIRQKGIKVIYSCYNHLVNAWGRAVGYAVQELPEAYSVGDIVTTDNGKLKKIVVEKYGFRKDDVLIHRQLLPKIDVVKRVKHQPVQILWAAHVRSEKNPEMAVKIAEKLGEKVEIDCYGELDPYEWKHNPLTHNVPENIHYRGGYNNFFEDIDLSKYALFLYTSFYDGTPNVLLEAGLAGLPIVSSAIGGIPELIGENGTLIDDPKDLEKFCQAIEDVIKNQEEAEKKALELHKKIAKDYGKDNFIRQVKEMLGEKA